MDQQKIETHHRVEEWLRAVPGLTDRLVRGIHVVDVGCGGGASTVAMAVAFPRSRFLGVDADALSVQHARQLAAERRLRNVYWVAAPVHQLAPLPTHDLICAFDGVEDMIDPRAALQAIHAALADDGVYLWCAPGERGLRELADEAGFSHVDKLPIDGAFNELFALRK
jgi:trans-aconitate methyltransferase